jgi:choline dehydrogenase-like flavoprotein
MRTRGPALLEVLNASTLEAIKAGPIDAIVVGSGAAGGLAAMLLTEAGLRVLVLEAGPSMGRNSLARRLSANALRLLGSAIPSSPPMSLVRKMALNTVGQWRQPIQTQFKQWTNAPELFVDDLDCPYITPPGHPFVWVRSRMLGGRMLIPNHGWQYYRLAPHDFSPADGLSPAWPLKAGELDPWYVEVERRLGIAGGCDGLPWLPDSELSVRLRPNANEVALLRSIRTRWPLAQPIMGRFAPPLDGLEAAAETGRLLCRQGAVVQQVLLDGGRTYGVEWIDQQTGGPRRAHAPLVFLCASALETTRLLLLSLGERSGRVQRLGAPGVLGRYLMDHIVVTMKCLTAPLESNAGYEQGRCLYLPRFDARTLPEPPPGRGFGVQLYQAPWMIGSVLSAASFGEMTPRPENNVTLDPHRKDAWNIPILRIDCRLDETENRRAREQAIALREIAKEAHARGVSIAAEPLGSACHECGTARMGLDPENSVLDPHNECWDARGLYVTDGASFPSQGVVNPTLTIMALTARACGHAARTHRG